MAGLPEPLDFKTAGSFPYLTITQRMPVILTKAIDNVYQAVRLSDEEGLAQNESARQGKESVSLLSALKYEMQTSKPMRALTDTGRDVHVWNIALESETQLQQTRSSQSQGKKDETAVRWFDAPWLLAECYMYRRIREALLASEVLADHDPFRQQKHESYTSSLPAARSLAHLLVGMLAEARAAGTESALESACEVLIQFSLWGNKSDLSLLAGQSGHVLASLQHGKSELLEACKHMILVDDTPKVWEILRGRPDRVDIVLDNAGFEVFSDLCLVHFLLSTALVSKIVLHGKCFGWFVSDCTRGDVTWVVDSMCSDEDENVRAVGEGCRALTASGRLVYQEHDFWTYPHGFRHMQILAPDLYEDLSSSALVIFKGDLNYRKLVDDRAWPLDASFIDALGPTLRAPLCALRTCKANVLVGVDLKRAEQAAQEDKDWLVNGSCAVIQGKF